jgi:hypothetical protein
VAGIVCSVADPGCVIPEPRIVSSLIPDPTSFVKGGGVAKVNIFLAAYGFRSTGTVSFKSSPVL